MSPLILSRQRALELLAPVETAAFFALRPLLRVAGGADQHPVLVLPGFGAGDSSTVPLRWGIRGQGYWVHAWRLGPNIGPTQKVVEGLRARVDALAAEHGRTISIIGWSLGGILARALARESPDRFRQVITLGSPYRRVEGQRIGGAQTAPLQAIYNRLSRLHVPDFEITRLAEQEREALTVPATSIYSRDDTFAPWQLCIDTTGPGAANPRAENIEVRTSHVGLGSNLAVLAAVLDRLGQPEGEWTPFAPLPGLGWMYPTPASWTADPPRRQRARAAARPGQDAIATDGGGG